MIKNFAELVERATRRPKDAQEQLVEAGREIESVQGGVYEASPDELAAIDEADAAETASEEEVHAVLEKLRNV